LTDRARVFVFGPAVIAAALLLQIQRFPTFWSYAIPDLPGFDAYVYVAAAEEPRIFTVAPWGHRVVVPWTAAALAGATGADLSTAFRCLTLMSVAAAAGLGLALLRRRGHGVVVSCLGALAVVLSPPLGEMIGSPYLVDAAAVAVLAALLLALEAGAPLAVLVALAVFGALVKEVLVLFLPVVFFARRGTVTTRLRDTAVVVAAAGAALLLLRLVWTPGVLTPLPRLDATRALLLWTSLRAQAGEWLRIASVGGLAVLAAAGAFRPAGREARRRYGYVLAVAVLQPVFAHFAIQQVVGEFNRYLAYAVPVLVVLAAAAVEPRASAVAAPHTHPAWTVRAAAVLAVVLAIAPPLVVDRYRRMDLQGRRDGLYVLAFCRESLQGARRLASGRAVILRISEHRFASRGFETTLFERMRWFLREGWGPEPHYGTDEVVMREDRATIVLPVRDPAALEVTLALSADPATEVAVTVNGREIGRATVGPDRDRHRLVAPGNLLFRGDNRLGLAVAPGTPRARLYAVALTPLEVPSPR
jgi:hypothetical protein